MFVLYISTECQIKRTLFYTYKISDKNYQLVILTILFHVVLMLNIQAEKSIRRWVLQLTLLTSIVPLSVYHFSFFFLEGRDAK